MGPWENIYVGVEFLFSLLDPPEYEYDLIQMTQRFEPHGVDLDIKLNDVFHFN